MINYILLSVICILLIEISKWVNLIESIHLVISVSNKIRRVAFSKSIGDNWKELVLPTYAFKIIQHTLRIITVFLLLIFCIVCVDNLSHEFFKFTLSLPGLVGSIIIGLAYVMVRKLLQK